MGAPGAEHELLGPFVGTFRAEVKLWMGPGEPQVSTGVMTNTLELGGKFLLQSYQGDPGEGPFPDFAGRGFWGYNKVDSLWEGVWIDTASTVMQTERGTVDAAGRVWTMEGRMTNPQDGSSLTKRSVITLVDDDHHTLEMYFETPGGEAKGMEIRYERLA
jgi:hypothetical protein